MEHQQQCKHMEVVDVSTVSKSFSLDEKQMLDILQLVFLIAFIKADQL